MEKILESARACFRSEIHALRCTAERLDDSFVRAVRLLAQSHKVIITGVGKSGIIGQKIAATLSSTNTTAIFLHPVEALHGDIGMVQEGDVVILISKSGNTAEVVRLMPYLKMRNVKTIAIVGNTGAYIGANADIVLDASVEREACPFNLVPTTSTTVALCMGDALAVCLISERNFTMADFSRLHPLGQIGKSITLTVKDVMKKSPDCPTLQRDETFKDALIAMTQKPIGCLCVIEKEGILRGILTDGDIRRVLQNAQELNEILTMPLENIMNSRPVTIAPDAMLLEALALMENRERQIGVLPVVNKSGVLAGVVRIHDVIAQ